MRVASLFPHLQSLHLDEVLAVNGHLHLTLHHRGRTAVCPTCRHRSRCVRSHYTRRLGDQPVAGQSVTLHLRVRRFRCAHGPCPQRIFTEQAPTLAARYARRTRHLITALEQVGLALGGRPGQRLGRHLRLQASRATLLQLVHALPEPTIPPVHVLGVDEFSLRRGRVYATLLVDVESHRPIDLLDERSSIQFATWLTEHNAPEILCRDRGGCYADGGRTGAPNAIQVADRWHLLANLSDAVESIAGQHRACWRTDPIVAPAAAGAETAPAPTVPSVAPAPTGRMAERRQRQFTEVQALLARGCTITAIAATLHLDRHTVRKYARAVSADATSRRPTTPGSSPALGPFLSYLNRRWDEGCTNAVVLLAELQARSYRGSLRTISRHLTTRRRGAPAPQPRVAPPSPRMIAGWVLRRPETLTPGEAEHLAQVCERCPELARTRDLARQFANVLRQRAGAAGYHAWQTAVAGCGVQPLLSFAAGLQRDEAAVIAGLTLPWSSGVVEGHNTRIKLIKRQMYGRASFALLRKRVLLAG